MSDPRETLSALDKVLGRGWAKAEIMVGLMVVWLGFYLGQVSFAQAADQKWITAVLGLALFVLGGYLALAGHRSHLYRWNNRNTVVLLDEIRRLAGNRENPNEHFGR